MIFDTMTHAATDIMTAIYNHPFNRELAQGILPQEKFIFYLTQDALYLADFAKALSLAAAKLTNSNHSQQLMQFSLDALQTERMLHVDYLQKHATLSVTAEQSPACFMYTNYLLKMASTAAAEEAVSSLLPCFWVYREVGKHIAKTQTRENPYQEWITLYASEQFDAAVNSVIAITNNLSLSANDLLKEKMINAFVKSTQLEWLFWQGAYQQEQWVPAINSQITTRPF